MRDVSLRPAFEGLGDRAGSAVVANRRLTARTDEAATAVTVALAGGSVMGHGTSRRKPVSEPCRLVVRRVPGGRSVSQARPRSR